MASHRLLTAIAGAARVGSWTVPCLVAGLVAGPGRAAEPVVHQRLQLVDEARARPVWIDIWSGAADASAPLLLLSHGAMGSALGHSGLAGDLAARGYVVVGVNHYGESWVYGSDTVDPRTVTEMWRRPVDLSFALDWLLASAEWQGRFDRDRVAAIGHSSGGATVIALAGGRLDGARLAAYCASDLAPADRGCDYAESGAGGAQSAEASLSRHDPRVRAVVALDPAVGPGHSRETLAAVTAPVLVVGAVDNDFLPFEHHARRYAENLPDARLIALDAGEGHFAFLDPCSQAIEANGVPICKDRPGVDRVATRRLLVEEIDEFLRQALSGAGQPEETP